MIDLTDRALAFPGLIEGAERARTLTRLAEVNGPFEHAGLPDRREHALREAAQLAEAAPSSAPALILYGSLAES